MARGRKRGGSSAEKENGGEVTAENGNGGGEYEKMREQRIKENREKMEKLGIFNLSQKLKPPPPPPKIPKTSSSKDKALTPLPARLSYAEKTPKSTRKAETPKYTRTRKAKDDDYEEEIEIHLEEGSKPEIYTEEQEKLLGDCKMTWTLLVDGYDEIGERMYDPYDGKSCHQCRQKTLGYHTKCSKCGSFQGQFCGDCLYTRYGENVIEVNQNPKWVCPVCREICNCSRCRRAKGWKPIGDIYEKVKKLGFKSVAHYLIQTHRGQEKTEGLVSEDEEPSGLMLDETSDMDENSSGSPDSEVDE
ncbi:hypothetical protein CCACVL1_16907 [Corchorus capsularis]|uniref:Zinc-finger domain-containing protein n=1 Tax=Corchorus capsularis TaxID=210143 RepID=A0A1R3HVE1_COCAP|nr:hypothetical protein CCACVL1_16907 [Corchorus capsularis]